ncbi:MAG: SMC-Scp complex subunit ScpB [Planctomycetes bacterium]|nr:SMC-Scp complex subunit ScpB [Planctomycetota bacterium]
MKSATAPTTFEQMAESAEQATPCADLPLEQRVEAVLMIADRPLTDARIAEILGVPLTLPQKRGQPPVPPPVPSAIEALNARYAADGRILRIESVAGGWQVMTLPAFGPIVARMKGVREQGRLTQAALESLAIIAYRQPILRADLESIRGVACGEVLRSLMDRRLVKIVGRADEVGRPMLYGTTNEFLKQFGIGKLEELPNSKELNR